MNIKPASKNQLKNWKKLLMGKYRKKSGLFLAEGERCVEQILENGKIEIEEIMIQKGWESVLLSRNLPVFELEYSDFQSVSDTESPQGIIAVCKIPEETAIEGLAQSSGIILATDAIQDPGNLGTMIRTAGWFNVAGILFGTGTVDPFHPKVVRSTAGATGSLPFHKGNLDDLFPLFEEAGWTCFLLDGSDKAENLRTIHPLEKILLVVGNEGSGIEKKLYGPHRRRLRIPGGNNSVESLNAAVALSIGLFALTE